MIVLIYSAAMSLDGFVAGPGGDMTWLAGHAAAPSPTADRLLAEAGALLCGGDTLHGGDPNAGTGSEGAFAGRQAGPTVALTSRPLAGPPPDVVCESDLHAAVARAPGGTLVPLEPLPLPAVEPAHRYRVLSPARAG